MNLVEKNSNSIRQEEKRIRKCASLTFSRVILLIFLFPFFIPLRPNSIYLFAFTALFPWILGNILENKKKKETETALPYCAKKFLYSPSRYTAEQCTGSLLPILLIIWQLTMQSVTNLHIWLRFVPVLCFFAYSVARIAGNILFSRKIYTYYYQFEILEYRKNKGCN